LTSTGNYSFQNKKSNFYSVEDAVVVTVEEVEDVVVENCSLLVA
jgi:hypothetical protein